jgi:hypothetical protein
LQLNPLILRGATKIRASTVTRLRSRAFITSGLQAEDLAMKTMVKVLIVLGFGATLAGCVVAPYGRPRAYVVAPAPVVVVHAHYYR